MRQFGFKKSHVLMGFGLLACLVPLYWAKSEADRMRNHMQNQEAEVKSARKKVKTLEAEVAFLSRYDRIEKVAIEELGMAPLSGVQIVDIKDIDKIAPILQVNAVVIEDKGLPITSLTAKTPKVSNPAGGKQ